MNNLRNPILLLGIVAVIAIAAILAWPQYVRYQEQAARRACAEKITSKKAEMKQALADWNKKCDEAKNANRATSAVAERFIEHSCEALYGPKPPEGGLSIDEERKLISLCLERKGFDE